MSVIKLETLRVNAWKMGQQIDKINKNYELLICQIAQLESIENENSKSGVEATIDPNRILTRRGPNSKKVALAQAINKNKNY